MRDLLDAIRSLRQDIDRLAADAPARSSFFRVSAHDKRRA
jgi:hypothetical protein